MLDSLFVADIISTNYIRDNIDNFDNYSAVEVLPISFTKHTTLSIATMDWLINYKHSSYNLLKIFKQYYTQSIKDNIKVQFGSNYSAWLSRTNLSYRLDYDASCAIWASFVGYYATNMRDLKRLVKRIATISNKNKESINACEITAITVYLAKRKYSKLSILKYLEKNYSYNICDNFEEFANNFAMQNNAKYIIRAALNCFFNSNSFIETLKNSFKFKFNYNTICCLSAIMSEAVYGLNKPISLLCKSHLPKDYLEIINQFNNYSKNIK